MVLELKSPSTPTIDMVVLTTLLGEKLDISRQFLEITLFEDIFSNNVFN